MGRILKIILVIITCSSNINCFAQDPFFSQFYNAPLMLNPALTGISYGNIRVAANYRNHLSSFDPFETYAFSMDMSLLENSLNNDFVGFGLMAVNDVSGYGLKNLKAMMSFAYHKSLNGRGSTFLSFSAQAGVDQTNISYENLSTQSQWVANQGVDRSLANGERFVGDNTLLFDVQAGMLFYSFINDRHVVFLGSSVFHITEPEKSVLDENSKLNRRYVIHAGGKIKTGLKTAIIPNLVYMMQNNSVVINSGLMMEYDLSKKGSNQVLSLGAWLRNTDALIINTGLEFKNMQIGVSYDLLIADLQTVTQKGGFEISLIYNFKKSIQPVMNLSHYPNPRF